MARSSKAVNTAMKLGIRYAPVAYAVVRRGRGPAVELTKATYLRGNARRQAMAHAQSLIEGSALRTFLGDQQVWVVFSKDEPVGSHPTVQVPLDDLLTHADLTRRIYPSPPRNRRGPNLRLPGPAMLRGRVSSVVPDRPALTSGERDDGQDAKDASD